MTNPQSSSDRNQVIYAQVIAKAWSDEAYKAQLLANPKQTLTEAGIILPESGTIQILENTEIVHYVVLPEGTTLADFKDDIATGLAPLFPLLANQEIIIRQATENVKYFVLPWKPESTSSDVAGAAIGTNTNTNPSITTSMVDLNTAQIVIDGGIVVAAAFNTNSATNTTASVIVLASVIV